VRSDTRAKKEDLSLATSPNYTLALRNGTDTINLEGTTNGIAFPPSRRKDCKFEQVDTPFSLTED